MGKRLIQQRRGRGTLTYRSPGHRFKGAAKLPSQQGEVVEFVNCPGHSAPLAYVQLPNKQVDLVIAPKGIKKGDQIEVGIKSEIKSGNVLQLKIFQKELPSIILNHNLATEENSSVLLVLSPK